jgi:hypothetical protein
LRGRRRISAVMLDFRSYSIVYSIIGY